MRHVLVLSVACGLFAAPPRRGRRAAVTGATGGPILLAGNEVSGTVSIIGVGA